MTAKGIFERCWDNVLAASSNDDFFFASRNGQVTVHVQGTKIAGAEVAVLGESILGPFRGIVVSPENGRALYQHFAVVSNPDLNRGNRRTNGADLGEPRSIYCQGSISLGKTVALENGNAQPSEEVAQAAAKGSAPRDDILRVRSQQLGDVVKHQLVVELAPRFQRT